MTQYIAFLRGINVGGKTIKMDALRKVFEEASYRNVSTVLASGNVVFKAKETGQKKIKTKIEALIKKAFGLDVHVILRSAKEIQALIKNDPFKGVKVAPQTRLYITFLSENPTTKLSMPYEALDGDYSILQINNDRIVSVVTLSPKHGTTDVMELLGKLFGANITTRNWNTIQKIRRLLS